MKLHNSITIELNLVLSTAYSYPYKYLNGKAPSYLEGAGKVLKLKQCEEISTTRTGYTVTQLRATPKKEINLRVPSNTHDNFNKSDNCDQHHYKPIIYYCE